MDREAQRSLDRILPRLRTRFPEVVPEEWKVFESRLRIHFESLFTVLLRLYGSRYDFFYHLEEILETAARMWLARPEALKALDAEREAAPLWFQSEAMVGGVCYIDLFAGDLNGLREKIPYFKELGLTYLHVMPPFLSPPDENDGGYAVSSYREIDPKLGTIEQFRELASELRRSGISLVLDFVYNHTSDEHLWARRAQAGDPDCEEFYFIFPDRQMPDAYDAHLREIFPDVRRGNFTYRPDMDRWVWTTFNGFQWDLNYQNPVVFNHMAEEMLFLANLGVEVLRLDAVAFTWKQLGTSCENLPEAHLLIQAFNALARLVAPALLFKSEAIVHPDDVARYIAPEECQLSYNPLLMALLWETLATREVRLLQYSMQQRFKISSECAWVNYVRCHDDIGWTFADEDAAILGVNGFDHRRFLNEFYRGRFPGSFARGLPFQENPKTGDCRISGTCASLAGLEKALNEEGPAEVELAIRRILLLHGIILTVGGIPLLYLGDEIGALNDYSYQDDPSKAHDSRWVHRPRADWKKYALRHDPQGIEGRVFEGLRRLIELRKDTEVFSGGELRILETENLHVLGFERRFAGQRALVFANFSEQEQTLPPQVLIQAGGRALPTRYGQPTISETGALTLSPLGFVVLA